MPEFQSFTLQAYTRLTLTARVIAQHATLSSNPAWVEISKKCNSDLKYELIFLAILLLVLTVVVAI